MTLIRAGRLPQEAGYDADIVILSLDRPDETEAAIERLSRIGRAGQKYRPTVHPSRTEFGTVSRTMSKPELLIWRWKRRGFHRGRLSFAITDSQSYFVSESSVYRLLKAHDLITSPTFIVIKVADSFHTKTTQPTLAN